MASKASQDIALLNNDLYIIDGDFAIAESDVQHVSDTIAAFPSWWKENAPDGVGILQYVKSAGQDQLLAKNIKLQLQSDGYKVSNPGITIDPNGLLTVDPKAIKL